MPHQTFLNLPDNKRELIISNAVDEFYKYGYEKASISRIVESSKIAKGSFYQYFEHKDDLYQYMVEMIQTKKRQAAADTFMKLDQVDYIEFLRRLFVSGISFFMEHPKYAAISNEFMKLPKKVNEKFIHNGLEESNQFLVELINQKKSQGTINSEINSLTLANMTAFFSLHFADYFIKHYSDPAEEQPFFEEVDNLLKIIEHGIR